jgi:hypothetical protein
MTDLYEGEKDALRDILAGGEFAPYLKEAEEPGQNLLLLWLERLMEALSRLSPGVEFPEGSGESLSYGLIAVGLLLLLGLTAFLSRLIWIERRTGRRRAVARADELEQAPLDLADRSRAAVAAGNYREATRLLFLALLLGFQQRELLRVEAWKTNWEYAEELETRGGEWVPLFRDSALRFDTVWYGGWEIDPEAYEAWREQVEAVLPAGQGGAR